MENKIKQHYFEMFHLICEFIQGYPSEENHKKMLLKTMEGNLAEFPQIHFGEEDIQLCDSNCVINSFNSTSLPDDEHLSIFLQLSEKN